MQETPFRFVIPLLLVFGAAWSAEDSPSTASAFMKCARIASDAQRLSCYDRLATELIELGLSARGAPATPPAPPAAPAGPPAAVPVPEPAPAIAEASPAEAAESTSTATGGGAPEVPPVVTGGGAAAVATTEEGFGLERVQEAKDKGVKEIRSRYVGEFTGWDGKTIFRLENGQVWQQIQSGRMAWRATSPMITIKRGFMGSYMLSVEGVNKTVRVKRIE